MGFTSVLVFNNDYLGQHNERTLKEVWSGAYGSMLIGTCVSPSREAFQGIAMPWNEHTDTYCLMLVGGYSGKVLCSTHITAADSVDNVELKLLQELATKLGYHLQKKK